MSKGLGQKIAVKFFGDLTGDVSGKTPNPVGGYKAGTVDFAQGKPVTVGTSVYGAGENAVDGNTSTYWGTYSTLPWWIAVDLVEIKKTAGFYIMQSNASYRGKAYTISGSHDNIAWVVISTGVTQNISEQTIDYPVSEYRYIKLSFTSYWTSSRAYVNTLKILDPAPVGNEVAFTIEGQQDKHINGILIAGDYQVETVEAHPTELNTLLITLKPLKRFNNVVGNLVVRYDMTKGNLKGRGGFVDSFETTFLPSDLIPLPNPNIEEKFTITASADIVFSKVTYNKTFSNERFTITANAVLDFIYVVIVNP